MKVAVRAKQHATLYIQDQPCDMHNTTMVQQSSIMQTMATKHLLSQARYSSTSPKQQLRCKSTAFQAKAQAPCMPWSIKKEAHYSTTAHAPSLPVAPCQALYKRYIDQDSSSHYLPADGMQCTQACCEQDSCRLAITATQLNQKKRMPRVYCSKPAARTPLQCDRSLLRLHCNRHRDCQPLRYPTTKTANLQHNAALNTGTHRQS